MLQTAPDSITVDGPRRLIPPGLPYRCALRKGSSCLVATPVWLVGLTLSNTLVGVLIFGDSFEMAKAAGLAAAVLALMLLTV
jgi:hypothetical protein